MNQKETICKCGTKITDDIESHFTFEKICNICENQEKLIKLQFADNGKCLCGCHYDISFIPIREK